MFEWSNTYSVGVASIDAQHQQLFGMARELYAAMSTGQGKSQVGRLLDRLIDYTEKHFAHEERLMRLKDYPELARHAAEHAALTKKVKEFQQEFQAGRVAMTVQLLQFLRDWLQHHIQESDKKYLPFMKEVA